MLGKPLKARQHPVFKHRISWSLARTNTSRVRRGVMPCMTMQCGDRSHLNVPFNELSGMQPCVEMMQSTSTWKCLVAYYLEQCTRTNTIPSHHAAYSKKKMFRQTQKVRSTRNKSANLVRATIHTSQKRAEKRAVGGISTFHGWRIAACIA